MSQPDSRGRRQQRWQGRFFEDFVVGDVYEHPLGRTVTTTDNSWFTLLTQNTQPVHFDHHYAAQTEFGRPLVDSAFTLALVTGQSVSDVSQNVMANLGWDEVRLPHPVFEGDTIYSESEVLRRPGVEVARERRDRHGTHHRVQPGRRGRHHLHPHGHGLQARPPAPHPARSPPECAVSLPVSVELARSLLFVPGARPDRFAKAAAAGADLVVIDLEDAVAPEGKDEAREAAASWIRQEPRTAVRVNAAGTAWHEDDVALAADLSAAAVLLPKAEDTDAVAQVARRLRGRAPLVLLVETAAGVVRAPDLAGVPGVARLAFGQVDLATELGVDESDLVALRFARSAVVMAARAAGLPPPIDGPTTAMRDDVRLAADLQEARRLGFGGKLCIHPAQVRVTTEAFARREGEQAWARRVLAAVSDEQGVGVVDGRMVDAPVIARARRVLAANEQLDR